MKNTPLRSEQTELSHYFHTLAGSDPDVVSVIMDIASASKRISHEVERSGLYELHGTVGATNIQGEEVQILDDRCNQVVKDYLMSNNSVAALASEEEDDVVPCNKSGRLAVAFDPIDGSSNIDINASVGTIFSILPADSQDESVFLQPSGRQLGAGYVLYGSSTVLVFSLGDGIVTEFTLDPDNGDYFQTIESIKVPKSGGFVSFNPSLLPKLRPADEEKYRSMLYDDERSHRYIGAMVADVHRTLLKGGVFAYPEFRKDTEYVGKLRMQYEVKPLGWLFEQAGGKAMIGDIPCGEFQPAALHERVPIELS
ncbi:MAG TPA: class 1 fructose-bisphosphatase [Candidatus Saccharimonadales bacterium]